MTKEKPFKENLKNSFNIRASCENLFYSESKGYAALDGIRVLGMISVIMAHTVSIAGLDFSNKKGITNLELLDATPGYTTFFVNANYMMDMFFVLSGFLIAEILFREFDKNKTISLKRFYYRRFMRLMPTYLFVIFVFYIGGMPGRENWWQNVLYINNFFPHRETFIQWSWSLAVEEQFYFLFPVLVIALFSIKSNFLKAMSLLFVLSFVIRAYVLYSSPILADNPISEQLLSAEYDNVYLSVLYDNLYTRYGAFICGIVAAYFYRYYPESCHKFFHESNLGRFVILLSLLIVATTLSVTWQKTHDFSQLFIQMYHICLRNIFSMAMAVMLVGFILNGNYLKTLNKALSHPWLYPISQLTYSAYLVHIMFVGGAYGLIVLAIGDGIYDFTYPPFWFVLSVFCLASIMTYILCFLIFILLENPLMRWRDIKSGKSSRNEVVK